MNILENKYLIENISNLTSAFGLAFIIAFLVTPLAGRLAKLIGAVDVPAIFRKKTERGYITRMQTEAVPRLGGLAMVVAIVIALYATGSFEFIPRGVILAAAIVVVLGFLEDTFELDGKIQIFFQIAAAAIVVITGTSITSIHFLGIGIDFNIFSAVIEILGYTYNFIFPADLITLLWIVGLMNVINWVGGVDGLTGAVSSIASLTMLIFAITSGNIALAIIISIHLGSVMGVFPYNYNPAKIYYGLGDYLNGFLLAIFAIIGSTRWTATIILLGMPIVDGILVFIMRFRDHPEIRKQPWKILSVSDTNHLHHRLLAAGYSRKTILLIEVAIMSVLCAIAIVFADIRTDVTAFVVGFTILLSIFTLIFFLKKRKERQQNMENILFKDDEEETPVTPGVVKVVKNPDEEEQKFVY
jgi:UDP-GlcNAc:undecaprenyl-phosphate/decaprenyl-phosphate GlcNAc-1-phosphate transferase